MLVLKTILIAVLFIIAIFRLATYATYGSLIKDKDWIHILEKQIQNGSNLNIYNSDIIYIGNLPYISNVPLDILGYYYISNTGMVPRWSKSHKLIEAEFEKLKQKN
jgi:hypothetical protein